MEERQLGHAFNVNHDRVKLPDVTVTLNGYEWQVHGELLTAQSKFFRAALEGGNEVSVLRDSAPRQLTEAGINDQNCAAPRGRSLDAGTLYLIPVRVELRGREGTRLWSAGAKTYGQPAKYHRSIFSSGCGGRFVC